MQPKHEQTHLQKHVHKTHAAKTFTKTMLWAEKVLNPKRKRCFRTEKS